MDRLFALMLQSQWAERLTVTQEATLSGPD